MDNWIVAVIVGFAAVFLARRLIGTLFGRQKDACGCGCTDCGSDSRCKDGNDGTACGQESGKASLPFPVDHRCGR